MTFEYEVFTKGLSRRPTIMGLKETMMHLKAEGFDQAMRYKDCPGDGEQGYWLVFDKTWGRGPSPKGSVLIVRSANWEPLDD